MILSKSIQYIGYQNKSKYKLGLNDIQSLRNICISEFMPSTLKSLLLFLFKTVHDVELLVETRWVFLKFKLIQIR